MVEVEFDGSGPDRHKCRRLADIAAAEAARDRIDRRESHGSGFENAAARKSEIPET